MESSKSFDVLKSLDFFSFGNGSIHPMSLKLFTTNGYYSSSYNLYFLMKFLSKFADYLVSELIFYLKFRPKLRESILFVIRASSPS